MKHYLSVLLLTLIHVSGPLFSGKHRIALNRLLLFSIPVLIIGCVRDCSTHPPVWLDLVPFGYFVLLVALLLVRKDLSKHL